MIGRSAAEKLPPESPFCVFCALCGHSENRRQKAQNSQIRVFARSRSNAETFDCAYPEKTKMLQSADRPLHPPCPLDRPGSGERDSAASHTMAWQRPVYCRSKWLDNPFCCDKNTNEDSERA